MAQLGFSRENLGLESQNSPAPHVKTLQSPQADAGSTEMVLGAPTRSWKP